MQPAFRSGRAQVRNALQCLRLPVAFLGCCTAVSVLEWQGGVAEGSAKLCSVNLLLCRCCGGRSVASVREEHSSRLRRSPPCRAAAARRGRVCVRVHAAALQPGADVACRRVPCGTSAAGPAPSTSSRTTRHRCSHTARWAGALASLQDDTHASKGLSSRRSRTHARAETYSLPLPRAGAGQSCTGGGSDDARSSMLLPIQMQLRIQMQQRLSAPVGGGHRGVLAVTQ